MLLGFLEGLYSSIQRDCLICEIRSQISDQNNSSIYEGFIYGINGHYQESLLLYQILLSLPSLTVENIVSQINLIWLIQIALSI